MNAQPLLSGVRDLNPVLASCSSCPRAPLEPFFPLHVSDADVDAPYGFEATNIIAPFTAGTPDQPGEVPTVARRRSSGDRRLPCLNCW